MTRYVHGFTAKIGDRMVDFGTGPAPAAQAIQARHALESHLGRRAQWMDQQHGIGVYRWSAGEEAPARLPRADVVFIDGRGTNVGQAPAACVVTADCVPVLIASHKEPLWAAIHAGRKGLEQGILQQAIAAFSHRGQPAAELEAWIGPAICSNCYIVDESLQRKWLDFAPDFVSTESGEFVLDLVGFTKHVLNKFGVPKVQESTICTAEDPNWYSYRRDPQSGRQVGYIFADI